MTWSDVTVWQWQQIQQLNEKKDSLKEEDLIIDTVAILINKTRSQVLSLSERAIKKVIRDIEFLYLREPKMRAVEYIRVGKQRFKCDYDAKFSDAGRYIEIKYFTPDLVNNLHRICASMVIPMKPTLFGWKLIEFDPMKHEDYAETLLSAPFEVVFGSVIQKLNNIKNLDAGFKGLFNPDMKRDEDDGREVGSQFMKYFGWIYQAKLVAEHEGIKLDEVYKMSTVSFLNDLSYLSSKNSYETELRKKANGKR
jgi:hypothetical protein